jgi:hypothetical protein
MEQRDFLQREIEKIGKILSAFRQILKGGGDNTAITLEEQSEATREMLLDATGFNLDEFLSLNTGDADDYIVNSKGFNIDNIELLAECMAESGFSDKSGKSKMYLEKALQLYELCNRESKTFSFVREANIKKIKEAM